MSSVPPTDPLRHLRRQAGRTILGGVAALLLAGLMAYVVDRRSDEWRRSADRVPATIVATTNRSRFPERREASVEVTFTYRDVARHETIRLRSDPEHEVGDEILLYVDRDDPGRVSASHGSYFDPTVEFVLIGGPALGGVVALVVGCGLLRQVGTQRRQLARLRSERLAPDPTLRAGPGSTAR